MCRELTEEFFLTHCLKQSLSILQHWYLGSKLSDISSLSLENPRFHTIVLGSGTIGICSRASYFFRDRGDLVWWHSQAHWASWNPIHPRQVPTETSNPRGEPRHSHKGFAGLCGSRFHVVKSALIQLSWLCLYLPPPPIFDMRQICFSYLGRLFVLRNIKS